MNHVTSADAECADDDFKFSVCCPLKLNDICKTEIEMSLRLLDASSSRLVTNGRATC